MKKTSLLALSISVYFLFAFTHHKDTNLVLENELKDAIVLAPSNRFREFRNENEKFKRNNEYFFENDD